MFHCRLRRRRRQRVPDPEPLDSSAAAAASECRIHRRFTCSSWRWSWRSTHCRHRATQLRPRWDVHRRRQTSMPAGQVPRGQVQPLLSRRGLSCRQPHCLHASVKSASTRACPSNLHPRLRLPRRTVRLKFRRGSQARCCAARALARDRPGPCDSTFQRRTARR